MTTTPGRTNGVARSTIERAPAPNIAMNRSEARCRDSLAERIYDRLHGAMAFLGVLFLAVVISERLVDPREPMRSILAGLGWGIWAAFGVEFGLRLLLSERRVAFLRRYWWQIALLALPFLNVVRVLAAARITRLGRALSAGVRSTETARSRLTGRLGWLASLTVVVVIVAADVLYQFADYASYASALRDAAVATTTGSPTREDAGVAQALDVVLATYSVIVVASLAAALGAFFLDERRPERRRVVSL